MIEIGKVQELLDEICVTVKPKRNKDGFTCKCPVCGDSSKSDKITRLHVDFYPKYQDWIAKCYNGGCPISGSTNLIALYAQVKGITFTEAKKLITDGVYDTEKLKDRLAKKYKEEIQEEVQEHDLLIPIESIGITDDIKGDRIKYRYWEKLVAFITLRHIKEQCFIAYDGRYKGRIILPVYLDGKIKYFQGRAIFDNISPKYLNPDIDKTLIIPNSDKFNRDNFIVVTEGLIDAWMVEHHAGTSCLGAYFSDELISALLDMTDKGVILCFDNPLLDKAGYDEILKFSKESKYKGKVKYFLPNRKDFKDLNELKILQPDINIYDYIVSNVCGLYGILTKLKLIYK